jgi:hypothetical protein
VRTNLICGAAKEGGAPPAWKSKIADNCYFFKALAPRQGNSLKDKAQLALDACECQIIDFTPNSLLDILAAKDYISTRNG